MDPATMYSWRVTRRTCEACRILEAEIGNDHESKTPRRGTKYSVSREV